MAKKYFTSKFHETGEFPSTAGFLFYEGIPYAFINDAGEIALLLPYKVLSAQPHLLAGYSYEKDGVATVKSDYREFARAVVLLWASKVHDIPCNKGLLEKAQKVFEERYEDDNAHFTVTRNTEPDNLGCYPTVTLNANIEYGFEKVNGVRKYTRKVKDQPYWEINFGNVTYPGFADFCKDTGSEYYWRINTIYDPSHILFEQGTHYNAVKYATEGMWGASDGYYGDSRVFVNKLGFSNRCAALAVKMDKLSVKDNTPVETRVIATRCAYSRYTNGRHQNIVRIKTQGFEELTHPAYLPDKVPGSVLKDEYIPLMNHNLVDVGIALGLFQRNGWHTNASKDNIFEVYQGDPLTDDEAADVTRALLMLQGWQVCELIHPFVQLFINNCGFDKFLETIALFRAPKCSADDGFDDGYNYIERWGPKGSETLDQRGWKRDLPRGRSYWKKTALTIKEWEAQQQNESMV